MSNIFSKYQKELASVKVIDSAQAYVYNPKTKNVIYFIQLMIL